MAAPNVRQAIPVITNAAAPTVDTDEVSGILAILDAALDAYQRLAPLLKKLGGYTVSNRLVTFFASDQPHAEYSLTLLASAKQLDLRRHVSKYDNGRQIRSLEVLVDGDTLVAIQWPSEPQPVEIVEPDWRPADNDEQPVEVTPAAIRTALRQPHWTDDMTTSTDERGGEVVTSEASR